MVHVQDQGDDAGHHQAERHQDREARDRAALVVDLAHGEDRLGEGGREQAVRVTRDSGGLKA
jgi:hypothetical protein